MAMAQNHRLNIFENQAHLLCVPQEQIGLAGIE
jgi:hypothetical protein